MLATNLIAGDRTKVSENYCKKDKDVPNLMTMATDIIAARIPPLWATT
jgi:hypothetical protein